MATKVAGLYFLPILRLNENNPILRGQGFSTLIFKVILEVILYELSLCQEFSIHPLSELMVLLLDGILM